MYTGIAPWPSPLAYISGAKLTDFFIGTAHATFYRQSLKPDTNQHEEPASHEEYRQRFSIIPL